MRSLTALTLLAVLATALTGCIETPDAVDGASTLPDARTADEHKSTLAPHASPDGRMTAEESVTESSGTRNGTSFPAFYAERVVTITGEITLTDLPVVLDTWDGDVIVNAGAEGEWALVATLHATGWTLEDARENLARAEFTWSHTTQDGYFLDAKATLAPDAQAPLVPGVNVTLATASVTADLALTVPARLVLDLVASTRDGDARAHDVTARGLYLEAREGDARAHDVTADVLSVRTRDGDARVHDARARDVIAGTRDGDVDLHDVEARNVVATTRDGDVNVRFTPTGDGALTASARDGDVTARVPESARHAYDATLTTRDGDARVRFSDGASAGDEDGGTVTYQSRGVDERAIRTRVTLETRDGDVTLRGE